MNGRATSALVLLFGCLAGVALMIGVVSLLTATLGSDSTAEEISIPYAIAWTAVALAVLGFAIAIPFYPHLRLQLVAITAAWTLGLVALIAAGGMREDSSRSAGGDGGPCTRVALESSSDVELTGDECERKKARKGDRG